MTKDWLLGRRIVQARAEIDLENRPDSFHAYPVPTGIDIRAGDVVQIHGIPSGIAFADHLITERPATVSRAGSLSRTWTASTSMLLLTEL